MECGWLCHQEDQEPIKVDEKKLYLQFFFVYFYGLLGRQISDKIIKVRQYGECKWAVTSLETFKESDELNEDDDGNHDLESSRDWFNMIKRGGLTRCTNDFYCFICNVELIVKTLLSPDIQTFDVPLSVQGLKLNTSICESWGTLTEPIEQAKIKSLLLVKF